MIPELYLNIDTALIIAFTGTFVFGFALRGVVDKIRHNIKLRRYHRKE